MPSDEAPSVVYTTIMRLTVWSPKPKGCISAKWVCYKRDYPVLFSDPLTNPDIKRETSVTSKCSGKINI